MSNKTINNSDYFRLKCLSFRKICAIVFCSEEFVFLVIFDNCDVEYKCSISLLQPFVFENMVFEFVRFFSAWSATSFARFFANCAKPESNNRRFIQKFTYKQNYDYATLNWLLLVTKTSNWRTNVFFSQKCGATKEKICTFFRNTNGNPFWESIWLYGVYLIRFLSVRVPYMPKLAFCALSHN